MGFMRRRGAKEPSSGSWQDQNRGAQTISVMVFDGDDDLAVVGESYYQEDLWRVVGGRTWEPVRHQIVAVLVPEPQNAVDPNAVSVWVDAAKVGYLSRADASRLVTGLRAMMEREGMPVAIPGVIVGGGQREDGLGRLGVFLRYDPTDFGLQPTQRPPERTGGEVARPMDTGERELAATGSHLAWLYALPADTMTAIRELRHLLETEIDPIERHYCFNELERRLYRARDVFASALDEYDYLIRQHDVEMEGIREALLAELGQLPVLETYKQASIRHQKRGDLVGARRWAQRGLVLYGSECCRPEAVEDLQQRVARCDARLSNPAEGSASAPATETLTCQTCGSDFERVRVQGRKPRQCPACKDNKAGNPMP